MSDLDKILLTSFSTICGGVILLVVGQLIIRFLIDPLTELRKLIGEISDNLIYYGNVYANPGFAGAEQENAAERELRKNASLLRAKSYALPFYCIFSFLQLVPSKADITIASTNLIGLSNSVHQGNPDVNDGRAKAIYTALNIDRE